MIKSFLRKEEPLLATRTWSLITAIFPGCRQHGVPVVMDVTHSLQQPNQTTGITGGNPQLIGTIAKAAIAAGADGLFIETHPNPAIAISDGANMLKLDLLEGLLQQLVKLRKAVG